MSFRVNEISLDRAREQSCAEQLLVNTAFGFAFSFAGSVLLFTFRAPSARAKVQPLFSALAMEVVPVLTASSALFTITQCTLDSIRETRDIKNTAVASAAVGALVGGLKYRSIVGAAVGAGVVALVGTGPEMSTLFGGSPIELAKRDYDRRSFIHTPNDLAASASYSARLVTARPRDSSPDTVRLQ